MSQGDLGKASGVSQGDLGKASPASLASHAYSAVTFLADSFSLMRADLPLRSRR